MCSDSPGSNMQYCSHQMWEGSLRWQWETLFLPKVRKATFRVLGWAAGRKRAKRPPQDKLTSVEELPWWRPTDGRTDDCLSWCCAVLLARLCWQTRNAFGRNLNHVTVRQCCQTSAGRCLETRDWGRLLWERGKFAFLIWILSIASKACVCQLKRCNYFRK